MDQLPAGETAGRDQIDAAIRDLQRQGDALRSPIASWPRPALTPEERQERRWAISPPYIPEPEDVTEEGEP